MSQEAALETPELCERLTRELLALEIEIELGDPEVEARLVRAETLRARSRGAVEKPETLNARTGKPERGGLMCARIFGPVEDHRCICGKYDGVEHRGLCCERCGVEVLPAAVRRERWGHLELAAPVVHPLFADTVAGLLGITRETLAEIVGGRASFDGDGRLRSAEEREPTRIGGEELAAALADASPKDLKPGLAPARLMLELLPVLPAGLRPIEDLDDGRRTTADVNDLYRRVVNRNDRVRRLLELDAPLIILNNEHRLLQASVDQLFDNGATVEPLAIRGRILRSLGDMVTDHLAELGRRDALPPTGWLSEAAAGGGLARVRDALLAGEVQTLARPPCSAGLAWGASSTVIDDVDPEENDDDF